MKIIKVKNLNAIQQDWASSLELEYCPDCDSYDCAHRSTFARNNAKAVVRGGSTNNLLWVVNSENKLLIFEQK